MSDPIPLTKPDGTVHAYACGVCGFVLHGVAHGGAWNEDDVKRTHAEALDHCKCRRCGREMPIDHAFVLHCDSCAREDHAERVAAEVQRVAHSITQPNIPTCACSACNGSGDCPSCDGDGWVFA